MHNLCMWGVPASEHNALPCDLHFFPPLHDGCGARPGELKYHLARSMKARVFQIALYVRKRPLFPPPKYNIIINTQNPALGNTGH